MKDILKPINLIYGHVRFSGVSQFESIWYIFKFVDRRTDMAGALGMFDERYIKTH